MCLGWYVVGGVVKRHWWNKGSGEEIIDISADQFDKFVPKIEILHPGEPRYERYVTSLYWEDVKIFCSPRG